MALDYSGVDYYTATSNLKSVGMQWLEKWNKHKDTSLKLGSKIHSSKRFGYNCVYVNGLTWGKHEHNGYMMTSSGAVAGLTWQTVLPIASKITRVDLHYTFQAPKPVDIELVYKNTLKSLASNRKSTVILNSRGGATLYIGSRTSDQYGRLYDKTVEAELDIPDVFRLEVELKKPRADKVFQVLYKNLGKCSLRATDVRDYVCSWFSSRSVDLGIDYNEVKPIKLTKVVSTDEKKLIWLKTSVAPTMRDLLRRGMADEVSKSLGLRSVDWQQLSLFSANSEFEKIDTFKEMQELQSELDAEK